MKTRSVLAAALGLTFLAFCSPARAEEAEDLLRRSLNPPGMAYEGLLNVTHWYDHHSQTEDVAVRFLPPNRYRWEFRSPDGSVSRVVVSDGVQETLQLPRHRRLIAGSAVKSAAKQMAPDQEWALLFANYELSLLGSDEVAGRDTWKLLLKPKQDGPPYEQIWIDKQSGIAVEIKRYRPTSNYAVLSRFTRFQTFFGEHRPSFEIVLSDDSRDRRNRPETRFISLADLAKATGRRENIPDRLPKGFVFESADTFTVDGQTVSHVRYTNGLTVISLFETPKPVRNRRSEPGAIQTAETGHIMNWKAGRIHYTLMGDVSESLMKEISASLE